MVGQDRRGNWVVQDPRGELFCGTTGEAPTLSRAERGEFIRIAVGASRGRVPAGPVPCSWPGTGADRKGAAAGRLNRATHHCAISRNKSRSNQIRTQPVRSRISQSSLAACGAWYAKQKRNCQRPGVAVRRIFGVYDRKDRRICPRRPPRCGEIGAEFLTDGSALHSHDQT
jgi:hypothetical protein